MTPLERFAQEAGSALSSGKPEDVILSWIGSAYKQLQREARNRVAALDAAFTMLPPPPTRWQRFVNWVLRRKPKTGRLRFFAGTQPPGADSAISQQTLLAELEFPASAFGKPAEKIAAAPWIEPPNWPSDKP